MKKAIIIFYSYSGNTKKVVLEMKNILQGEYETKILQLDALDESKLFFKQVIRAITNKRAKINEKIQFDLSEYDLVVIGTPVWAFAPVPALNTYLDKCTGLENKNAIVFATYGSGIGKDKCVNMIKTRIQEKGAQVLSQFLIQQFKIHDGEFLKQQIAQAVKNEKK